MLGGKGMGCGKGYGKRCVNVFWYRIQREGLEGYGVWEGYAWRRNVVGMIEEY